MSYVAPGQTSFALIGVRSTTADSRRHRMAGAGLKSGAFSGLAIVSWLRGPVEVNRTGHRCFIQAISVSSFFCGTLGSWSLFNFFAIRLEAIASRSEAMAITLDSLLLDFWWYPSSVVGSRGALLRFFRKAKRARGLSD